MVDSDVHVVDLSVYFVADPAHCNRRRVEDVVDRALQGGATCVQYRDKGQSKELIYHTACLIRDIAFDHGVTFIMNDHLDIAHDIYADGVHLGQGDADPADARDRLGPAAIVGVTAFTEDHLRAIDPDIVDYVGMGPFYETQTDKGKPVLGAARFAELVALSPVPVVGIGGIEPATVGPVMQAGARGVAAIRAISEADEPADAAAAFVLAVQAARGG